MIKVIRIVFSFFVKTGSGDGSDGLNNFNILIFGFICCFLEEIVYF